MPLDALFTLGPFLVDGEGRLQPGEPDCFPTFSLVWRGRAVRVRMNATGKPANGSAETGILALHARIGRVPSTAQPEGTICARERSLAMFRGLARLAPVKWSLILDADHSVAMEARLPVDLPVTAVDLIATVTGFLLELAPFLDLLDDAGVTPV